MPKKNPIMLFGGIVLLAVAAFLLIPGITGGTIGLPNIFEKKHQITCDVTLNNDATPFVGKGVSIQNVGCYQKSNCDFQLIPFSFFGQKGKVLLRSDGSIDTKDFDVEVFGSQTFRLNVCVPQSVTSVQVTLLSSKGQVLATRNIEGV